MPISRYRPWLARKQINPPVSTGNVETGEVTYEYNLLKSRGPRRIHCSIQCPVNEDTAIDPHEAKQLCTVPWFCTIKHHVGMRICSAGVWIFMVGLWLPL